MVGLGCCHRFTLLPPSVYGHDTLNELVMSVGTRFEEQYFMRWQVTFDIFISNNQVSAVRSKLLLFHPGTWFVDHDNYPTSP